MADTTNGDKKPLLHEIILEDLLNAITALGDNSRWDTEGQIRRSCQYLRTGRLPEEAPLVICQKLGEALKYPRNNEAMHWSTNSSAQIVRKLMTELGGTAPPYSNGGRLD